MSIVIPDLDGFLSAVVAGQPPGPHHYEFRCHPGVAAAIWQAAERVYLDEPPRLPAWGTAPAG